MAERAATEAERLRCQQLQLQYNMDLSSQKQQAITVHR